MGKKWNGKKMSHAGQNRPFRRCPLCGTALTTFRGMTRCTEEKRVSSSDSRRMVKCGSLATIKKRLKKGYPNSPGAESREAR